MAKSKDRKGSPECPGGAYSVLGPGAPGVDQAAPPVPCAPVGRTMVFTELQKLHPAKFAPFWHSIWLAVIHHHHHITGKRREQLQNPPVPLCCLGRPPARPAAPQPGESPELGFIKEELLSLSISSKPLCSSADERSLRAGEGERLAGRGGKGRRREGGWQRWEGGRQRGQRGRREGGWQAGGQKEEEEGRLAGVGEGREAGRGRLATGTGWPGWHGRPFPPGQVG